MKLRLSQKPMRRKWAQHPHAKGLLLESDLRIGSSRLRAKLLVFSNRWQLHRFWRDGIHCSELGHQCLGAVNGLYVEVQTFFKRPQKVTRHIEADPRYFAVIGLVRGHLNLEIIAHESVHAAYAYTKRQHRSPWDQQAKDMDEEEICYPTGQIACEIVRALRKGKLID